MTNFIKTNVQLLANHDSDPHDFKIFLNLVYWWLEQVTDNYLGVDALAITGINDVNLTHTIIQ